MQFLNEIFPIVFRLVVPSPLYELHRRIKHSDGQWHPQHYAKEDNESFPYPEIRFLLRRFPKLFLFSPIFFREQGIALGALFQRQPAFRRAYVIA